MNQKEEKQPCYEEMKPYEKFLAEGPEHLTEAELLAIIIRTGNENGGLSAARQTGAVPAEGAGKGTSGTSVSVRR